MTTLNSTSSERRVKILAIALTLLLLVDIFRQWGLTKLMLSNYKNLDFGTIQFLLPKVILLIGLWGLWTINKYGWTITTAFITYFTISTFLTTIFEIKSSINNQADDLSQTNAGRMLNEFMGQRPIVFYIGQLLIIGTIMIFINTHTIRDLFRISRRTQLIVLGLTCLFFIIEGLVFLLV